MTLLDKIKADFSPQVQKNEGEENEPEKTCGESCRTFWRDHTPNSPPRCAACDPPPTKTKEHVSSVIFFRGAENFDPPPTDAEWEKMPCGLPGWPCTCGSKFCPRLNDEKIAAYKKRMAAEFVQLAK